MPGPLTFEPWSPDYLPAAAELLAARQRTHRGADPDLPELDRDWAQELIGHGHAGQGFVALRAGELVGYLLSTFITDGPHAGFVWSDLHDHAAVDTETTRSLYAHAARHWVAAGRVQHVVHVPAVDSLLWPWFLSSFGVQHTWSLRDSSPLTLPASAAGIVIRRIGPDEATTAGQADLDLSKHLQQSPVFSAFSVQSLEEATAGQREFLEEPDVYAVVAERDGVHLAYGELTRDPKKDLRGPGDAAVFGIIVVDEHARGTGVGRTITAALLDEARRRGHTHAICDWAAGNLESSRAFTSFGWRPTFFRLHRTIA